MTDPSNNSSKSTRDGRGLGWAAIVVGVILCLGILSSLANQGGSDTSSSAETAGEVVGRLLVLALAVAAIVFGVRRLRRQGRQGR